jgi:hypothetical protein
MTAENFQACLAFTLKQEGAGQTTRAILAGEQWKA